MNPRDTPTGNPCIGECSTSFGGDFCRGCGRTVAEIREWNTFTNEQKIIVKQLAKRRLQNASSND